jgi:hypothetical protein
LQNAPKHPCVYAFQQHCHNIPPGRLEKDDDSPAQQAGTALKATPLSLKNDFLKE